MARVVCVLKTYPVAKYGLLANEKHALYANYVTTQKFVLRSAQCVCSVVCHLRNTTIVKVQYHLVLVDSIISEFVNKKYAEMNRSLTTKIIA